VDVYFPDAGMDAVRLLRSLGVEVDFPSGQTCCGQPAFNAGHVDLARNMASNTRSVFRASGDVVLPSGSCAAMVRHFAPKLLAQAPEDPAPPLEPPRFWELSEFIVHALGAPSLGDGLQGLRVAYHHGCHALRELGLRDEALRLLQASGAELLPWEAAQECCGFGGLFSVKFPEVSVAMSDRKLDVLPTAADVLTSADGGCLLQLDGRMRRRGMSVPVVPLASLLWRARSPSSAERREDQRGGFPGAASESGGHAAQ
jgi:L-lactate dehydrogenase complex protein LldE